MTPDGSPPPAEDDGGYDPGDHSDCIQPHRTADGYTDCDGRPL